MSLRRSGNAATIRVAGLCIGLVVGATLLTGGAVSLPPPSEALAVHWWVVVAGFALAHLAVVYLHFGENSEEFSLSEIPFVVALVALDPLLVVVARLLGSGMVALWLGRRTPVKAAFNVCLMAFETALGVLLFRAFVVGGSALDPAGWAAAAAAVVAASAIGILLVPVAASAYAGRWQVDMFRSTAFFGVVTASLNTGLGLLIVVLLTADTQAVWLLIAVGVLLFAAYRGYIGLRRRHENLLALQGFIRTVGEAVGQTDTARTLLQELRSLLRAEVAELVVLPEDGERRPTALRLAADDASVEVTELAADDPRHHGVLRLLDGERGVVAAQETRDTDAKGYADRAGVADAVAVPLRNERRTVGTLLVGNRLGDVESFTDEDRLVAETVAQHVAVTLDNGRLVDRLRQEAADKAHQAAHDQLTGLPNRWRFADIVEETVASAAPGTKLAVLLLDLDRFKEINDTLGHHVGDRVLDLVGARLRRTVQLGDTVARLGGDEFGILLAPVDSEDVAVTVAERVRASLEQPLTVEDMQLSVGSSIGVALWPEHGSAGELLQRADVAMYHAKGRHTGVEVYEHGRDPHSHERLAIVSELRMALAHGELEVHYQPKADLASGEVVGVEALVRWPSPERGWVPPDEFIPIAERTGLIHPLTEFVVSAALAQCRTWRRAGWRIDVAVNLAVASLLDRDLPNQIERLLADAEVDPGALTLEITESGIMTDPARAIEVLGALHTMGVRLAIDDFGTGFTSLSQLKNLPVDELKIDRAFVGTMTSNDSDAVIVRSTVDLARNLGLRVVAEGVEDQETWDELATLECQVAQGYFLSKALPPALIGGWLAEWEAGRSPRGVRQAIIRLAGRDTA